MSRSTYVIGDIHGCFDALRRLEDKCATHAARRGHEALVVGVGDLVDRGVDAAKVVRHFRRGVDAGTHACVLGNHEVLMLLTLAAFCPTLGIGRGELALPHGIKLHKEVHAFQSSPMARSLTCEQYCLLQRFLWVGQGGAETLASYGVDPRDERTWSSGVDPADVRFLLSLPLHWQNDACVVTHALVEASELEALRAGPVPPGLAWSVIQSRKMPAARPDPTRIHISGHTPLDRVRRKTKLGLVQVDTACCFGKKLTAYCVDTGELLAVPALPPAASRSAA
jgi:hypothetical protein